MIRFHIKAGLALWRGHSSLVIGRKRKAEDRQIGVHSPRYVLPLKMEVGSLMGMFALNKFCFKLVPERRNWKVRVKPYQEYSSNRLISSGNHPSPGQMEFPPERLYDIFYLFYRNLRSPPSMLLLWPSDTLRRWESTNRKVSQAAMSWNGSCHLVNRWKRRCFITFS